MAHFPKQTFRLASTLLQFLFAGFGVYFATLAERPIPSHNQGVKFGTKVNHVSAEQKHRLSFHGKVQKVPDPCGVSAHTLNQMPFDRFVHGESLLK